MDGSPPTEPQPLSWWLLALLAIVVGQVGLARELFAPGGLTDSRPVMSGRHPLHLYHGILGATTFRERSSTACYDPSYQAGYPKTPVFDGGCRPAELGLLLAGSQLEPVTAYKLGLFSLCLFAPIAFAAASHGAGLNAPACTLAASLGALFWWTPAVRALLDAGNADLLLAGLMGLVFVGGLVRYATSPGVLGWLLLSGAAVLGWYAHPIVWLGLLPVLGVYYVALAPQYGLAWHLGLVGVTAAGLSPNMWWLWDWGRFWWLRQPSVDELTPLPTWGRFIGPPSEWLALIGCSPIDWFLAVAGGIGLLVMLRQGHRVAAGVLFMTSIWAAGMARLGETWPTLQIVAAHRIAPIVLAALVPPAAYLMGAWWSRAKAGPMAFCLAASLPLLAGWGGPLREPLRLAIGLDVHPLMLGVSTEQRDFIHGLRAHTTADARILIEELNPARPGWNWTALLALQSERLFLGGLDQGACVEHTFCGMHDGRLNGRVFTDWTSAERAAFCRRYNVGWVVCRSPESTAFWRADPMAKEVGRYRDGEEVVLFVLDRPRSFVLAGTATVERMDRRGLVLTDCAPDPATGDLVLSLHHQPGFRAAPTIVGVDADKDPFDPIPMLKLRLPGPASRITLIWENP